MAELGEGHLRLLLQANRILSSTLDLRDVLAKIMELAMEIVTAEGSSVLLLDEQTNELVFDVTLGEKSEKVNQVRLKVGEGIAGWVAGQKKSIIVNDVENDPRWSKRIDTAAGFTTRSVMCCPLVFKGKLLGVLEVVNKQNGAGFTGSDMQIIEAFSAQAAISIATSRLFSDITAEKDKMQLVFSEMVEAAIFFDTAGKILFANHYFSVLTGGYKNDIYSTFENFSVTPPLKAALSSPDKITNLEFAHRERKFFLSGKLGRVTNPTDTVGYILLLRDVTDEKKTQHLKKDFLSLISHKLKTPLVSIIGYSDLLLQKLSAGAGDAPMRPAMQPADLHSIETINKQGQYLDSLVTKLLNFAMVETGKVPIEKKPTEMAELTDKVINELQAWLQQNGVILSVDPTIRTLPVVNLDEIKIYSVLKNLIDNAVKFNDKPQKIVRIVRHDFANMVGIAVEDNGEGIPPEYVPKVFQEFFQIEESFTGQVKGMGLGLAISKLIVESHDGRIGFDTVPGKGSRFYFVLPVH
ncbi:MAG: GAF domain-containing sensor histidine kinase [Elusimicrobia bacterium]|nr:GAF domain-containing sensor histidine kinase [Elusimicrobiota bacterium]